MPDSTSKARVGLLICLLLAVVTLAVYWPVIRCEFVRYDDTSYIAQNPHVRTGLSWDNVRWAFTTTYRSNWHPLTWISHMLDCQLYGLNPAGHHATNLLLHMANSILIFLILRRMTGAQWRSAFVAALFALHPLHVESVAWVAERKDVLSTFFWALTIWAYVRYAQTTDDRGQKTEDRGQTSDLRPPTSDLRPLTSGSYWLALLFFAPGLLAKPMLVTLPFLLLLLDFWPLRRTPATARVFGREILIAETATGQGKALVSWKWLVVEKAPFLVLSCVSSAITVLAQTQAMPGLRIPFHISLENALLSYVRYVMKMVWPARLVVLYPWSPDFATWHLVVAIIALACFSFIAIRFVRRCPYLFTGWFWFVGTLVPVIGLVQVGLQSMADRYTYVPLIGLFLAIAWGGYDLAVRWQLRPVALASMALLPILACIPVTRAQIGHWKNTETLFEHTLRWTSDNYIIEDGLAAVLLDCGQLDAARIRLDEALRVYPDYPDALCNLGLLLVRQGKTEEGIARYQAALRLEPTKSKWHFNLALALAQKGDLDAATSELDAALRLEPGFSPARVQLAQLLVCQGKQADAKAQFLTLLQGEPDNADAHVGLSQILAAEKDFSAALNHLETAARLRPNDPEIHLRLGAVWSEQGNLAEAVRELEKVLRLSTNHWEARDQLGQVLIRQARTEDAWKQSSEAARINPTNALVRCHLALALDRLGRTKEAVEQYHEALALNPRMPAVLNNLAWILAAHADPEVRNGAEAVRLAEQACELTGFKEATMVGTLGAAYAEAGRFEQAVEMARKAEALAAAAGHTQLADKDREMAELFLARQPFHESNRAATNPAPARP
jgi:tetratricopeptide (TPR) repeat protein